MQMSALFIEGTMRLNWVMEIMVVGYTACPFHGYFDQLQRVGEKLVLVGKLGFIMHFSIRGGGNGLVCL